MKKLFQATFEQSLKLNNDNRLMECMEKSSKHSLWYRVPGPLVQGAVLLLEYYGTLYLLTNTIPNLWIKNIIYIYIGIYWIIYLLVQIIICRKQIIISDCWYKITAGQYMILFSIMSLTFVLSAYYSLHVPMLISIFCVFIFIFSMIYFIQKIYNKILKILYNKNSENNIKWFDHFYRWVMKYGGILVITIIILKWMLRDNYKNLEGVFCAIIAPFIPILCLNMGIHYLFEFVNAYYLVKYSEEYREHYGFTIQEWYGKYSKRAIQERRMKKKNKN